MYFSYKTIVSTVVFMLFVFVLASCHHESHEFQFTQACLHNKKILNKKGNEENSY